MTAEQKALIEKENHFRHLFAEDSSNPQLGDAHLLLENVFQHEDEFVFQDETEDEKRVPKLLTQCRKLGLTGKAIVSQNEFTARWNTFTNGILNGLDWKNVFCAGGAVLANLIADNAGYNSSDIDLFLYGLDTDEAANAKLREIHALIVRNTGARGDVIRTARAVTILNTHPFRHVQVVLRCYKSPAEVLLGFDIDSCTVGYDGNNVYCMERFKRALTKRYNLVNISRRSLTYEQRLYKYSRRGFAVAVPNLDKSRVNANIFTKQVKELFGLSKLLLYDYLAQRQIVNARMRPDARNYAIDHQDNSDYNGEMEIPWGPNFSTQRIIRMLKLKDRRQFFGQMTKMKEEAKKAGSFGQTQKKPEHLFETIFLDTQSADGTKTNKIEWIRNNPAYQDIDGGFTRPLMTGSFQLPPPVQAVWDMESYSSSASNPQGLSNDQGFVPGQWAPPAGSPSMAIKKVPKFDSPAAASTSTSASAGFGFGAAASSIPGAVTAASPVVGGGFASSGRGGFMSPSTSGFGTGGGVMGNPTDLSAFGGPSASFAGFGSPSTSSAAAASTSSNFNFGAQSSFATQDFSFGTAATSSSPTKDVSFSPQKFSVVGKGKKGSKEAKETADKKPMPSIGNTFSFGAAAPSKAAAKPSTAMAMPSAMPAPHFQLGSAPSQQVSMDSGWIASLVQEIHSLKAFITSALKDTSSLQHPTGQEEAPPTTKLLLLVSLCYKQGSLSQDEKNTVKDLIIARNEAIYAALEVFEVDQDIEELVDTFKRVVKSQQRS
jgi:hypothetical protein